MEANLDFQFDKNPEQVHSNSKDIVLTLNIRTP